MLIGRRLSSSSYFNLDRVTKMSDGLDSALTICITMGYVSAVRFKGFMGVALL